MATENNAISTVQLVFEGMNLFASLAPVISALLISLHSNPDAQIKDVIAQIDSQNLINLQEAQRLLQKIKDLQNGAG